jgi:Fe-S cluster assembly ATP-binding protein
MTRESLLAIQNLSASVDEKPILDNVNLEVAQGEVHVLMGPNGAGKSTMGHVVMGDPTYTVTGGSIMFDGADITQLTPDKRSLAGLFLSFQAPVEIPGVPLSSFLRATLDGREGMKMKNKEFRKRITALAEELDFGTEWLDRELGVGFSGGEKKKVEMLQLLLLQPKLAILDETDSGLDVDALSVVSKGMDAYREKCDGTLLVITHNTRILEHLSVDRVHVMVDGHVVAEGDADMIANIDSNGFEQFQPTQA